MAFLYLALSFAFMGSALADSAALAADDECTDASCAVNALQLQGQKIHNLEDLQEEGEKEEVIHFSEDEVDDMMAAATSKEEEKEDLDGLFDPDTYGGGATHTHKVTRIDRNPLGGNSLCCVCQTTWEILYTKRKTCNGVCPNGVNHHMNAPAGCGSYRQCGRKCVHIYHSRGIHR
mmetsp:Transcript_34530/g.62611  ORF Transcript_34530/g.62611 Transcript_34530/m.62611 type:complete len:176 (-) Transcript_34530:286-813(-)